MSKKSFTVLLAVLLMFGSFAAIPMISAAIKNPGHIISDSIGMPETIDPAWGYDTASGSIIFNVYDTLVFNKVNSSETRIEAGDMYSFDWHIATACNNINPDGTIKSTGDPGYDALHYNFTIRTGIPWQEGSYGTVSIYDVEYSIERVMVQDRSGGPEWMFYEPLFGIGKAHANTSDPTWGAQIDAKVTVDAGTNTVQFNLAQPYPPFLNILTQTWGSIVCKQWVIDHGGWNGTHVDGEWQVWHDPEKSELDTDQGTIGGVAFLGGYMMGCGPYEKDYWDHLAGEWSIVRFSSYYLGWGARGYNVASGKYADRYTEREVAEWADRKLAFMRGDCDFCYVPRPHTHELDGIPGLRQDYPIGALTTRSLFFNMEIASTSPYIGSGAYEEEGIPGDFFSDIHVRRAFAYLFNQTLYLQDVLLGEGQVVNSVVPPVLQYYNDTIPNFDLNIAQAYTEFQAAHGGTLLATGFTCVLTYNSGNLERQRACEMVIANLHTMCVAYSITNFHATVQAADWPTYLGNLVDDELAIFTLGWLADYPDAHNFVYPFLHTFGDFSAYTGFSNSTIDNWINTEIVTPNDPPGVYGARSQLFYNIQLAAYELCPSVALPWSLGRHWERDWVQGYYVNLIYPGFYVYHLYKEIVGSPEPCDISALGSLTDVEAQMIADHGEAEMEIVYPSGTLLFPTANITVHVHRTDDYLSPAAVDVIVGLLWMDDSHTNRTIDLGNCTLTRSGGISPDAYFYWIWEDPSIAPDNYTIWINVSPIDLSMVYDETPGNDEDSDGVVEVEFLACDTHSDTAPADTYVEMMDYWNVGQAYGSTPVHVRWNPSCDVCDATGAPIIVDGPSFVGDEYVEMMDYWAIGQCYGDNLGWT